MARKKKKLDSGIDESLDQPATDVSEIGKSSNEVPVDQSVETSSEPASNRFSSLVKDFTVFDAFLLISLVCISLATLRVFLAMAQYGGYFWAKPWNVPQ